VDEYRYHETLVHPPLLFAEQMRKKDLKILLLGAGDGLAVREIIKHPSVSSITVVDLDPAIIDLAKTNPYLHALNRDSLNEPRVRIVIGDANGFLQKREHLYDVIIADLPDPNNTDLSRLYSREFFRLVRMNLISGGVFMTQATSPYYAKKAFWCINKTIALEFKNSVPLHTTVPSFGDWGFVMASDASINPTTLRPSPALNLRYLDTETIGTVFVFPKDVKSEDIIPSTLDRPVVLEYYLKGWRHWGR
jgi:spermidine synthase